MFEDGSARTRLAWVLDQPPSAATHAVLEGLLDTPLPGALRVLACKAWDRQLAAMTAIASAARVAATVCSGGPDEQDDADAELALALRRTDNEMAYDLHRDRLLTSLPVLFSVFRAGDCTLRHVNAFLDITDHVPLDDVLAVDAAVAARAATMTVSGFRRVVRKTTAKLDSRTPDEKTRARRPRIGVRCLPQPDGLVTVAATMPAADGIAYLTELNRRADETRAPDDKRTHGERQIDVLLDALHGAPATTRTEDSTTPSTPPRPSRRTEIQVVIDWRSLLGLRDDPAELLGYGSITAHDVRGMLAEPGTTLRRLVTDPITGVLVDYGTSRYRPDTYLTGLTKARDVTCRYPGCTRNAMYCDDEHCNAFPHGATSAGNVCQLCRRHHRRKTRGTFAYTRPDPATGQTKWTTPLGYTYVQDPASYDESGPDPGDTHWIDDNEAELRWIPPHDNNDRHRSDFDTLHGVPLPRPEFPHYDPDAAQVIGQHSSTAGGGLPDFLGVETVEIGPGRMVCQLPVRDDLLNTFGTLHGGVVSGLADHILGAVLYSVIEHGAWAATTEFKINLLAPIRTGTVRAEAEIISMTKRTAVVRIDITNDGRAAAAAQGTVSVMSPK